MKFHVKNEEGNKSCNEICKFLIYKIEVLSAIYIRLTFSVMWRQLIWQYFTVFSEENTVLSLKTGEQRASKTRKCKDYIPLKSR